MSTNVVNQVAYLRTSREFPQDPQALSVQINKTYIDIANAVNERVIGIYSVNRPSITGESWFLTGRRQQTFRQVYQFSGAGNIDHGIIVSQIAGFTHIYGTFTDGTNWYPLPFVSTVALANQVSLLVTPTQIQITSGGGTTVSSGFVVLEWLSNV